MSDVPAAVAALRTPAAVRERCGWVHAAAERDELAHFRFVPERLPAAADYVIDTIRASYPTLAVPYHSRWRHFAVGGVDRWAGLVGRLDGAPTAEIARVRFDLAVTSVLLDAGAGASWRYVEPATGQVLARSEGLAVASFDLFTSGALSADPERPLRADADSLRALTAASLARAFQVRDDNPLVGLEGRCALLNRLGDTLAAAPERFGRNEPRVGGLFDHLVGDGSSVSASRVLTALLDGLGDIWPGRIELGGVNLGDVGRHPAARTADVTSGLVPFHKLSQWLAYSLIEPIEDGGIPVTGLDELTALAEYRNGGLLVDLGVLAPKHAAVLGEAHATSSETVVEWRALTVALSDRLADVIRAKLGFAAEAMPLAKILEGGTWSAGRRIARELRPDGSPPLRLISDGTTF